MDMAEETFKKLLDKFIGNDGSVNSGGGVAILAQRAASAQKAAGQDFLGGASIPTQNQGECCRQQGKIPTG
jgi:hypothetical protein